VEYAIYVVHGTKQRRPIVRHVIGARRIKNAIPAKRGGQAGEVAASAVWLTLDEASYVMGHMLLVDGGMTIGGFEL
jgi:NAD(P)-dependent dehydrogenase (short-subunit alcohol dehydrogenase family)